mmetsp:Transcript_5272/g.6775  ORF Transcript_5272/g.6775 Transcript_5272/m.6775 type:complete len:572 (+) Transcript_5272:179-1894(+)
MKPLPVLFFLFIFLLHESHAWLSAPSTLCSYTCTPNTSTYRTDISPKYERQRATLFAQNSSTRSLHQHPKPWNIIKLFTQFLSYHLRRFLWPGLSKNFDQNLKLPLPEIAPLGCPFFGNNILAGSRKKGPEYFYSEASAKLGHPRIWRFYFMGQSIISVSGSDNVNAILQTKKFNIASFESYASNSKKGEKKKKKPKALFSSNSLMFEKDRKRHQFLRHLVGAAFTPHAVEQGMTNIVQAANQQISKMKTKNTEKMEDICDSFTLDIAWRQIIGLNLQDDEDEVRRFQKAVNTYLSGIFSLSAYLNLPWKTITSPYRARKYLVSKIEERIAYLERNGPDGSTLSAMMCSSDEDSEKTLSHDEIVENVLILLLAGTETTSSTLTSAVFFLGLYPHVWKKLVQEQKEISSTHGTNITKQVLEDCTYLEAVIKETMRIVPLSGVNLRTAEEAVILDGKQIPKGANVFCNIRLTHELDPSTVSMDPVLDFTPEKWLDTCTKPIEYMPFGTGSRRCLGESLAMTEMRVFLSILARRIERFELLGYGSDKKTIRWKPASIIPKPLDGVSISITHHIE